MGFVWNDIYHESGTSLEHPPDNFQTVRFASLLWFQFFQSFGMVGTSFLQLTYVQEMERLPLNNIQGG